MASRRNLRRKQCIGKKPLTMSGAMTEIKKQEELGRYNLHWYVCRVCHKYHLGHKAKSKVPIINTNRP